jgi:hypothetical protein
LTDSTANGNNGSNDGAAAASGKIGGGVNFSGSSQFYTVSNSTSLNNWSNQTISFWVNAASTQPQYARFIEKGANSEWTIVTGYSATNDGKIYIQQLGGTGLCLTGPAVLDNTWHRVDITLVASTGAQSLYVDGTPYTSTTCGGSSSLNGNLYVSQYEGGGYGISGTLDEIEISNSVRSSDWIKTQFNNQNSPTSFISVGSQQ